MNNTKWLFLVSFWLAGCFDNIDEVHKEASSSNINNFTTTKLDFSFPPYFGTPNHPDNNITNDKGVELGRFLFYDKILSRNDSIACSSCHKLEFAFSDNRRRSIGIDGKQSSFNSPTLQNLAFSGHITWDGSDSSLEIQALSPIINIHEMDQRLRVMVEKLNASSLYRKLFYEAYEDTEITSEKVAFALAQFQRSLVSNSTRYDYYRFGESSLSDAEINGLNIYREFCADCHQERNFFGSPENFTGFANNGLDTENYLRKGLFGTTDKVEDIGKFKIQTLRNIEVSAPYMHDGRFNTLDEVLSHYNTGIQISSTLDNRLRSKITEKNGSLGMHLTVEQTNDLKAFLLALTDKQFLTNPDYSDPF